MEKIVSDASSAIYLAKSHLLEPFSSVVQIILPKTVYDECMAKKPDGIDVSLIWDLVSEGKICVCSDIKGSLEDLTRLDSGEQSVIRLFREISADRILTDDGEAVRFCRKNKIPFLSSPFVPAWLYENERMDFAMALQGIRVLGRIGYFSEEVLQISRKRLFLSSRLKGILFDMDGVLMDSMKLHDAAWRKAFLVHGLEISKDEIYKREGEKGSVTAQDLLTKAGMESGPEAVEKILIEKEKLFKQSPKAEPFPRALECVEELFRMGYRLGLVTGSFLEEVKIFFKSDFLTRFRSIVTANSVHQGKPHPEPYLKGLEDLALLPEEVVVVENAPYGIRAAKAAGLACVALATSLPGEYLIGADLILPSLDKLADLFNRDGI